MKRLENKVAVVTGGGTGIGRAISLQFAREGANVVVISNVEAEARSVAEEVRGLGAEGVALVLDVTDVQKVKQAAEEVVKKFNQVDILVTSAGIMGVRDFIFNMTEEGWRKTIDINLNAGFYCIKAFLPKMLERNSGRVIMISSTSGKLPASMNADYAASKHGVIGLAKALAIEVGMLGLNGITCNAICPGNTATPMIDAIAERIQPMVNKSIEEVRELMNTKSIQHRFLDPSEIAYMAAYLASDEAKGVTGQALNVCGGTVLW